MPAPLRSADLENTVFFVRADHRQSLSPAGAHSRPDAAGELLDAARRDAGQVVSDARAEISRVLLKARHELVVLAAQVDAGIALTGTSAGEAPSSGEPVEVARHELLRVLHEARPDLGALAAAVSAIGPAVPIEMLPAPTIPASTLATTPAVPVSGPAAAPAPSVPRRRLATMVAGGTAVVLAVAAGLVMFKRGGAIDATIAQPPVVHAAGLAGDDAAEADRVSGTTSLPALPAEGKTEAAAPDSSLVSAAERWLAAYYTNDRAAMAVLSLPTVTVTDDRTPAERLVPGIPAVHRSLGEPTVQVFGSEALLSARMIERDVRSDTKGSASVSFVSQMWSRRGGDWRVSDVRIVSAAALDRAFRR